MRKILILAAAAAMAVLLLVPGAVLANTAPRRATADRNRDRIPDRWERRYHLSLRVRQTRLDQDRDGLNNLGEFRARTNPRDADTDNDGIRDGRERRVGDNPNDDDTDNDGVEDGDENAGTVGNFNPTTGVLTINLASGGTVSGRVTGDTEIECEGTATASAADHGGGDNSGPGSDNSGPGSTSSGSEREGDEGEEREVEREENENDEAEERACTTADLTQGRVVHEAELRATSAGAVFEEIELR